MVKKIVDAIIGIVKTMRPKHWIKNVVVFAALVFSSSFLNLRKDLRSLVAFLLFCLVAGSVYLINDITDVEEDRKHPEKSKRPIPSGELPIPLAAVAATVFSLGGIVAGFYLSTYLGAILATYLVSNLLYSFWLEEVIIIDVFVISLGFVLRAIAGAVVIDVHISSWLIISTMFLALFLALNKRKAEKMETQKEGSEGRSSLEEYTQNYLDQLILVVTTSIIVSYSLYTFNSVHSDYMLWTIPFVLYGVFRYMYLTEVKEYGGQLSDVLLKDKSLVADILLWGASVVSILVYFNSG